jgi:anthranilate phosphoribosyltransferase
MNQHWILDIYRQVKEARDKELSRILSLLRPKAENDPEIGEALRLLEEWMKNNPNDTDNNDKPVSR